MKKSSLVMLSVLFVFVLLIACVFVLSLQGCSRNPGNDTRSPADNQTNNSSQDTTDKPTTTSTTEEKTAITLYYVEDYQGSMFLVGEQRSVSIPSKEQSAARESVLGAAQSQVQALAKIAVEELIKGPASEAMKEKNAVSLIPRNTKVLSVAVVGEVATVDFSREVLKANVGSEGELLGIYQIVNTLTELPTIKSASESEAKPAIKPAIKRVRFTVEGDSSGSIDGRSIEDWWGHVGLSGQPFERDSALIQGATVNTNTISIEIPRAYTAIQNPVTVEGAVQVFEATFQVCVKDMNDKVLADQQVMASDFNWGSFKKSIKYDPPQEPERGIVLFYYYSPKDGSRVTLGSVPVFFAK